MTPFSMKCKTCGEYISCRRKFNAKKETPLHEKYLGIQIIGFYIKCPRFSSEIVWKTNPQNRDYVCERGAIRNSIEKSDGKRETVDDRLDRLQAEEELETEDQDSIRELEMKIVDAKREMVIADALDTVRIRDAVRERVALGVTVDKEDLVDEKVAREAFRKVKTDQGRKRGYESEERDTWKPSVKRKKKHYAGTLGIKRLGSR